MNVKQEDKLTKKIIKEYVDFIHKTHDLVKDAKKSATIALEKLGILREGEYILIKEDGSYEKGLKENEMPDEDKKEKKFVILNEKEVTEDEFNRQKEIAERQGGAMLEETSDGKFRLHLNG